MPRLREVSNDLAHMKLLTTTLAAIAVSLVLTIAAAPPPAVDPPTPGLDAKVQAVLNDIRKADTGQLAISAFLRRWPSFHVQNLVARMSIR